MHMHKTYYQRFENYLIRFTITTETISHVQQILPIGSYYLDVGIHTVVFIFLTKNKLLTPGIITRELEQAIETGLQAVHNREVRPSISDSGGGYMGSNARDNARESPRATDQTR